jgi:heme exporter protein A
MTDAPAPLFEARSIHVWRGERHLLRGVSFRLHAGELLQITGPNGVGKSTLLRSSCRLLPMEEGQLFWQGAPIETQSDEFDAQLAYLAHSNALKADLTAEENLGYELTLRRKIGQDEVHSALELLGIPQCAKLPMRVLSAGQRRRLSLARVWLCKATLWILDEPSTNLDTAGIAILEKLMIRHLEQGGAILTAAHQSLLNGYRAVRNLELRQ